MNAHEFMFGRDRMDFESHSLCFFRSKKKKDIDLIAY